MKTCEILFDDGSREVECSDVELSDGILAIKLNGSVKEMWNMSKISGVILHENGEQTVPCEYPERA